MLFPDVVLLQHSNVTYTAIHHHIAGRLKMAPHHLGGAGKGCHVPPRLFSRSEDEDDAEHNTDAVHTGHEDSDEDDDGGGGDDDDDDNDKSVRTGDRISDVSGDSDVEI